MSITTLLEGAWSWVKALWAKYDVDVEKMAEHLLPIVISVAQRTDLTGPQKRDAILAAVLDSATTTATSISQSMVNQAIEVATNKYNIQVGKTTVDQMDATLSAVMEAARKHAAGALNLPSTQATQANATTLSNQSL